MTSSARPNISSRSTGRARSSWPSAAARMAACWWVRPRSNGPTCSPPRFRRSVSWTCCASASSRWARAGSPTTARWTIRTEFKALLAYSPLQNVKAGVNYPATLVTTGDHDDRVYPAHSFKFTAAMQQADPSGKPILLRDRDARRAWRRQADGQADRGDGGYLCVHFERDEVRLSGRRRAGASCGPLLSGSAVRRVQRRCNSIAGMLATGIETCAVTSSRALLM